jgi:hypothetical protein
VRLLPSEVSRIRYEDLRAILLDYYREHKPRSITKLHTGETDSDGNKLTEEVFAGVDKLDKFFKRMPCADWVGVGPCILAVGRAQLEAQIASVRFSLNSEID